MNARLVLSSGLLGGLLFVCAWAGEPAGGAEPVLVTKADVAPGPEEFHFVILADRAGSHRPGVFSEAVTKVNLLRPEFVMCVGDLIDGGTEDEALINQQWNELESLVNALAMPFHYLPGNHDYGTPALAKVWAQRRGASYHHFVHKDVLFLCLNSEDGRLGNIGEEQARYAADVLARYPSVRWTLVFIHRPLWEMEAQQPGLATGWAPIEELLRSRPHTVFAGHLHEYLKAVRGGRSYIRFATTGASAPMLGPDFGRFDEVAWVTMTKDGPRLANLELSGIHDEDVRNEEWAALVRAAVGGSSIAPAATVLAEERFASGVVPVTVTNETDYRLTARALIRPHPLVRPEPYLIEEALPPHTTKAVDVQLRVREPAPLSDYLALPVEWSFSHELPGRRPVTQKGTWQIGVERLRTCTHRTNPVVVDGKLDEWESLPVVCARPAELQGGRDAWTGPEDCTYWFACASDDEFVYVAVEARDDALVLRPGRPWAEQDAVEVWVAGPSVPEPLLVALTPGATSEGSVWFRRERAPEGTQAACVKTASGHVTEVAVPLSYLKDAAGNVARELRLNVAVNDVDDPAGPAVKVWWRPNWSGGLNFPGSGTFRREVE